MFLERFAIVTLQVRTKLLATYTYLLQETNAQLGQIFFTCCFLVLSGLLWFVLTIAYPLWFKIGFIILYLVSSLFCMSVIYFILKRKRIRTRSNTMEVYTLPDPGVEKFRHLKLKCNPLTEVQVKAIYNAVAGKYLQGNYQSFQYLVQLKQVPHRNRLVWKDLSPKRPQQVNRQTLLEFLDHLLIGFENLDNHQIILLVEHYFTLINPGSREQHLSSKNISDWRKNKAPYLKEIPRLFKKYL